MEIDLPTEIKEVEWLEPWEYFVDGASAPAELEREMPSGHVLYGRKAVCIARRYDCDDVLFRLPDGPAPYAVVHLTYRRENNPEWPWTVLFSSLEEWVEKCMKRDHRDYIGK